MELSYYEWMESVNTLPEKIVAAVFRDLLDRRGIRQELEQIDDDIRQEMLTTITIKVAHVLEATHDQT